MAAEAAAYHARNLQSRAHDIGADVRLPLELGRMIPATTFLAAQRLRARLAAECAAALTQVDVLLVPSTPIPAPRIGEQTVTLNGVRLDIAMLLSRNMMPFNLTGLPAIAIPCGRFRSGLPIALQLAGRSFDEAAILRVAHTYEQATEWHRQVPALETTSSTAAFAYGTASSPGGQEA